MTLFLLSVLGFVLGFYWWPRYVANRDRRRAEQAAQRERMQAVHDEWTVRQLWRLPESEDAND